MNNQISEEKISIKENLIEDDKNKLIEDDIFKQYNIFVKFYNKLSNENSKPFRKIKENKFYNLFIKFQKITFSKIFSLLILIIPGLNLIFYSLILIIFVFFKKLIAFSKK